MVRKGDLPANGFVSLHIVERETGLLLPATCEFQDRFLAKRTRALALAPSGRYPVMAIRKGIMLTLARLRQLVDAKIWCILRSEFGKLLEVSEANYEGEAAVFETQDCVSVGMWYSC